jgi:sugar lactone lactonase YvrE
MNWKKILIIIGFIGVIAGLGYLLYYFFFRPLPPAPVCGNGTCETGEDYTSCPADCPAPAGARLPAAKPGVPEPTTVTPPAALPSAPPIITPPTPLPPEVSTTAKGGSTWVATLTSDSASGLKLSGDGKNLVYYDKTTGKFYRSTPDGVLTALSDKTFYNVDKINWSSDTSKAILEYPDGSNILFDFTTQKQVTLPKHWQDFDFSPDGNQIVAKSMGLTPEARWLVVSNPDGSDAQAIEDLGENGDKVQVAWSPNNQIIATSRTGEAQGFDRQQVLLVGMHGENFKSLTVEGWGFDYKWSTQGDRMLYNAYNSASDYKPLLWIVDAQGDNIGNNRKSLGINTWANKCTFADDNTVYCAVPQTMERGYGMMPELSDTTPDTFYKIDLTTGLKTPVAVPYGTYTADKVTISADGQYLYFTDKTTGRIQRIQLK